MKGIYFASSLGTSMVLLLSGCSSTSRSRAELEPYEAMTAQEQGVHPGVWEPPIVDVIEVPPGLDPEGHYYRPAHEEIVEIRQGRWNYKGHDGK